jgi:UDP-N-acetylglucosamine 1-carboxyvinyltransferase
MDTLHINGGNCLKGSIKISGSKNASLPILAATLLSPNEITLRNLPHLQDITTMVNLLNSMGSDITVDENMNVIINTSNITESVAPHSLVSTMRASILVLGPLLTRFGKATVSMPGGCAIGARPVDMHLSALEQMGADIEVRNGFIVVNAPSGLKAAEINFKTVTVTGTENIMMAAVLAKGTSIINNCACEPEVIDLAKFLNSIGAKISGFGTRSITVEGVKQLSGCTYRVSSDRIEAATYLAAALITRGKITVQDIDPKCMGAVLEKMQEAGASITTDDNNITLDMRDRKILPVNITTSAYPGFPTDMQAQFAAIATVADGTSTIVENVFESRFNYLQELTRLGAKVSLSGNKVTIFGVKSLSGAEVMATDLRASASLVIATLVATGKSVINRVYHIDRGYEHIEEKLRYLGTNIRRIS